MLGGSVIVQRFGDLVKKEEEVIKKRIEED